MKPREGEHGAGRDIRGQLIPQKLHRFLLGACILLAGAVLSGCAALIEDYHVQATDNDVFTPFLRASVVLKRGDATAPDAGRRMSPSLRQGNVALDLDVAHMEGKDEDPARQRTFSINT
jgi:hypothetical protein